MLRSMVRNFLCFLLGLSSCFVCPNLTAAEPEASPSEWKLVSTSENVELYRRQRATFERIQSHRGNCGAG